jgi:hypothetical protein
MVPGNGMMELETTTVYSTAIDNLNWRLKNITAKNVKLCTSFYDFCSNGFSFQLCKMVLSASEVIRNTTFKWPLNLIANETDTYPFNDFDYMKTRVRMNIKFILKVKLLKVRCHFSGR